MGRKAKNSVDANGTLEVTFSQIPHTPPTIHRQTLPPESFQDILNQHQEYYLSEDPSKGFVAGDTLIFYEWDPYSEDADEDVILPNSVPIPPRTQGYTGRTCQVTVNYVEAQSSWLKPGVVMLGITLKDTPLQEVTSV